MTENDTPIVDPDNQAAQPEPATPVFAAEETVAIETTDAQAAQDAAAMEAESKAEVAIPENNSPDNPLRVLEALLFASDDILTTDRIKEIVPGVPDGRKIRQMVEKINVQLGRERHPFEIVEIGGGYQFRTVSYYYPGSCSCSRKKPRRNFPYSRSSASPSSPTSSRSPRPKSSRYAA